MQEYDFRTIDAYPKVEAVEEFSRVWSEVFRRARRDAQLGHELPALFRDAGIGEPDGTDVVGLLTSFPPANAMMQAVYRSVLPAALQMGITTEADSRAFFQAMDDVLAGGQYHAALWPLLIGAWKRKPA